MDMKWARTIWENEFRILAWMLCLSSYSGFFDLRLFVYAYMHGRVCELNITHIHLNTMNICDYRLKICTVTLELNRWPKCHMEEPIEIEVQNSIFFSSFQHTSRAKLSNSFVSVTFLPELKINIRKKLCKFKPKKGWPIGITALVLNLMLSKYRSSWIIMNGIGRESRRILCWCQRRGKMRNINLLSYYWDILGAPWKIHLINCVLLAEITGQ